MEDKIQWHPAFCGAAELEFKENKNSESHMWLKVLTKKLARKDADRFVTLVRDLIEPGDKNNADAVFEVSASANKALYEEMRRDPYMCNALREIMKEEMEEEKKIGKEIGKEIGRNQLADAITRLRNGEDIDKIKASGIDEETIELARSLL